MNVNKKLGRFKQWAGERMGGEVKTSVSDDFKSLEIEMGLRQEGMERLQKSMTGYVKTLSKRQEGDDKEKILPVAYLGSTMVNHGEDFEDDSEFGQCLISAIPPHGFYYVADFKAGLGRTNERIGRIQETYVANATTSWLESLERSLAQMKEYQSARKKLESRRLAYDASLAKMQKAKREDFKVEEELRSQKARYEETSEDVYRRMQDIKEAEVESVADLGAFVDAELKYYDRCRDVLQQLKQSWPAGQTGSDGGESRRDPRSRSNTAHAYADRFSTVEEEPLPVPEARPSIRSTRAASSHPPPESPRKETQGYEFGPGRPGVNRANTTFEGPTQLYRDSSPPQRVSRVPSDNLTVRNQRSQLRPLTRVTPENDFLNDPSDDSTFHSNSSPDRSYKERSASPATSHGSGPSRSSSYSTLNTATNGKKQAPPPPPSRAKKPPPPPPPMKYKQLKEQGTAENDPELLKCQQVLTAFQKHQRYQAQKQAYLQQQAQRNQQNQHHAEINGVNGHTSTSSVATSPTQASSSAQQTIASEQTGALYQKPQGKTNGTLSAEQVKILQSQIYAFKLLSKNSAIPDTLQQQLFKSQQNKAPPTLAQAVAAADQVLNESRGTTPRTDGEDSRTPHMYKTFVDPHSFLRPSISYANHSIAVNRPLIPAIMPTGVDVEQFRRDRELSVSNRLLARKLDLLQNRALAGVDGDRIREDRERIAYNRITSRKSELESLPANLGVWDTRNSDIPESNDSLKRKALIEYKMLCLLPKQRALRQKVHKEFVLYDNLAQTANRSMYRRPKKLFLHEARMTEKLEKQQRDARETKEKEKQTEHFQAITQHGIEIAKAAETQRARVQKLGRLMLAQHQHIEKEEQKRVERTAKQRLQALKNDDEETYLKLLGQAKDSRISHLLKQTDGFLSQLAASVKQQQRGAVQQYTSDELPEEESSDSEDEVEGGPKVDYYAVAHRIKEEIKEQPDNLIGGTLKEYQIKGLQWMISLYNNNLNGILADEMGLGKTIQTISLLTYLIRKKNQQGPFLVIVPLSTLTNWNLEFEKWAPSIKRIVYKGPPLARKTQQQQIRYGQFQVLLTTYEYIIKDKPVLSRIKWVHMIVDEGHRMKNAQSKLSNTLTQFYSTRYRLILTGTPLQNNLPELWALLNFVLPTIFKSVKSFDEWFNTPFANTGGQDKMELTEEEQLLVIRRLHKVLRPFLLRRLKKDVEKDLPDKQERVIKCKSSALQAKIYKQLVTFNKISVSDGKGGKTGIRGLSNMLMQLRKLCNHPFVFEQVEEQMNPGKVNNDLLWRTSGKFELLDRILPKFKATGHRILMFFQMTQIMNIMEDFLRLRGMEYLRLDGSTKSDDRSELLAKFNAPNSPYFCFLLSTRAGGLGLNLQTADTVIIYDSDWNPHQDLQAQDRAHRIGQKNEVRILRLITSKSVEEKILERAQYKLDMDGKVIQAGRFDNKSTNEERDAMLRTLLDSAETAEEMANEEEMDDDELNLITARSDNELAVFQKIDEERARDPYYGPEKGKKPRLMEEDELPDMYLHEDNPVAEEIEEIAGRGARERTRVKYDDGLTEEQWLMAVDDDEDTIEDAVARKAQKIDKRNTNKDKRARKAAGVESSPEPSRDSSVAPSARKRKPTSSKRKADEDVDDEPAPKKKRGGASRPSKAVETLSNKERQLLQKILLSNYKALQDLEEEVTDEQPSDDEDGPVTRGLIDPFEKPVPRQHFPDYYLLIQKPICMDQIKKKIDKEQYQSLKEYRDDIGLLCNNARTYNEDGSMLWVDANQIEATAVAKLRTDTEKHPELQDFDGSTPGDGRSAAVSSVGTPIPSTNNGGTRLKLTMNSNREGYANGVSDDE